MDDYHSATVYPTINQLDLTQQTYNFLKHQILQRDIKSGEKISIETVAAGLGVSRTPVVNALKLLERDGLVEIFPRRGTFVTELTTRDVNELFDIRLLIELYAAEQLFISGKIPQILAEFETYLEKMRGSVTEEEYIDYDAFITADRDMHTRLVETIDNRRLINIYHGLNIHMGVARAHYLNTVESALQAQKEHQAMLEAIRNHDLDGLKQALCNHINAVKTRILDLLEERGGKL
jgi:DNA-binding GntR family transcriptional regulator